MTLDINKLLKEVLDMRKNIVSNLVLSKDNYKEKYIYLSSNSPTLFEMVYKDEGPYLEQLKFMIENANKIKRKELSQYDADVEVGANLANKYIYPNIDMEKENQK